jgi:hypothetical protein
VFERLLSARTRRVSGAISGQLSQALVSFTLSLLAAHALGASGLGVFALVYSAMITTTALCNGMVGDSLTVMERGRPRIRSALQSWCLITSFGTGVITAGLFEWGGLLDAHQAFWFALANATFLVESMLRRLLMAVMRFWSLVTVDLAGLVGSLVLLGIWRTTGPLTLDALLIALVGGQVVGLVMATVLLPAEERWLAPWRPAAMREVAAFGSWRAIQQCIRPSMLTLGRVIVTAAVGTTLFGQMEAGRVYMSPALLVVQGLGSYLFSSYAQTKNRRWAPLVRRADRSSLVMMTMTMVIGAIGTLLVPVFGHLITGPTFHMLPVAVFGWAVYAASSAAVMPYASLAAVRGRQRLVVLLRTADSVATLGLLAFCMFQLDASASAAPYLLAVGSFVDAVVIRWFILRRYVREEAATDATSDLSLTGHSEGLRSSRVET